MSTKTKGDLAETLAARFLESQGFRILARNYRKKWGELDIVAIKDEVLQVVEVKASFSAPFGNLRATPDAHVPEENVHPGKLRKIRRATQTFLLESGEGPDAEFRFHVVVVHINKEARKYRIKWIQNVVL